MSGLIRGVVAALFVVAWQVGALAQGRVGFSLEGFYSRLDGFNLRDSQCGVQGQFFGCGSYVPLQSATGGGARFELRWDEVFAAGPLVFGGYAAAQGMGGFRLIGNQVPNQANQQNQQNLARMDGRLSLYTLTAGARIALVPRRALFIMRRPARRPSLPSFDMPGPSGGAGPIDTFPRPNWRAVRLELIGGIGVGVSNISELRATFPAGGPAGFILPGGTRVGFAAEVGGGIVLPLGSGVELGLFYRSQWLTNARTEGGVRTGIQNNVPVLPFRGARLRTDTVGVMVAIALFNPHRPSYLDDYDDSE